MKQRETERRREAATGAILVNEHIAAVALDVSVETVRKGRQGKGCLADLPFLKLGRAVRYKTGDIAQKIASLPAHKGRGK